MFSLLIEQYKFSPEVILKLTFSQIQIILKGNRKDKSVSYEEAVKQIREYRRGFST